MTTYTFDGDRLVADGAPVPYTPTKHMGGRTTPTLIVLHDTAGRLNHGNSARYLTDNPSKVSCHFVVERDGAITQLAPPDRRTNHAGRSEWQGRKWCNGFSVGIEIVNPGKLVPRGEGGVAWFGQVFAPPTFEIEDASSPAHGGRGRWLHYTPAQLDAVSGLVKALGARFPSIEDVVGHHDISPGRKVDPTPFMDWERMRRALHAGPVAAPPAFETTTINADTIRAAQVKLAALGYLVPPRIDGIAGVRTRAAAFALQTEHGLAASGALDDATLALLDSGEARPVPTGHREDETLDDLAAAGSPQARTAIQTSATGAFTAVLGTMTATTVAIAEFVTPLRTIVGDNWQLALLGVGCAIAWLGLQHWKSGRAAAAATLARHHAGQI